MIQTTINQPNVRVMHVQDQEGQAVVILQFEVPQYGDDGRPVHYPGTNDEVPDHIYTIPMPAAAAEGLITMLQGRAPSKVVVPKLVLPS